MDVVTCAAVNAGAVRGKLTDDTQRLAADTRIRSMMFERMGRLLHAFEVHGSTHLVLGSFGTGAFKNDVSLVATLWADLVGPGRRFHASFQHIEFAIIDEPTFMKFDEVFTGRCFELKSLGSSLCS